VALCEKGKKVQMVVKGNAMQDDADTIIFLDVNTKDLL
jgi:hypothetical protein